MSWFFLFQLLACDPRRVSSTFWVAYFLPCLTTVVNVHTLGGRWKVGVVVVRELCRYRCCTFGVCCYCLISVQLLLHSWKNINKKSHPLWLRVECLIYSCTFNNVCICSGSQSCLTLCDPMDYTPPGSSVHGVFQARILEWVAISHPKGHLIIQTLLKVRTVCKLSFSNVPCMWLWCLWLVIEISNTWLL